MTGGPARLVPLAAGMVAPDQPLPFALRDAAGQLLLAKGHVLAGQAQIETLIERGACVEAEELSLHRQANAGASPPSEAALRLTLFGQWEHMLGRLDALLKSLDEPGFEARARSLAQALTVLVDRDPDIALYLAVRQDERRMAAYGLTHALHTALLGLLVGRRVGAAEGLTASLMLAALTMNLSVIELQGRLACGSQPPTPAQQDQLRQHPAAAVQALQRAGVTDAAWLDAVAQHHERPGGGGYPHGLAAPGEPGQMLRHADVFMAKISPRAGRPALRAQEAERQLFAETRGAPMAAALIKEFGIYPPGDFVLLKSGERAVVVRRGPTAHTPQAAAITTRAGAPIVDTVLRDTADPAYAIAGPAPEQRLVVRVPPERLFGLPE